jgi:hypothetical protein
VISLAVMSASQIAMVQRWVREILALPKEAKVSVHARKNGQTAIVVSRGSQLETHVVDGELSTLNWAVLAQALLRLGPSCSESRS